MNTTTLSKLVRIFNFSALILIPWSLGFSQDESLEQLPPPTAPYVGTLSGDFTLVKKITYLASDVHLTPQQQAAQNFLSPASTKIKELDAIEKGAIRKDTQTFADGSSRDIWRLHSYRFTVYVAHPDNVSIDVITTSESPTASYQYQDAVDFPELDWIKGTMYQGIQMQQGKKCYTYKLDDQTAWLDVSNRLPIYFESKTMQVSYTYSAPPNEPLQLPSGFTAKLQKFKRSLRGQI